MGERGRERERIGSQHLSTAGYCLLISYCRENTRRTMTNDLVLSLSMTRRETKKDGNQRCSHHKEGHKTQDTRVGKEEEEEEKEN